MQFLSRWVFLLSLLGFSLGREQDQSAQSQTTPVPGSPDRSAPATTVYVNGNIITINDAQPRAVAARGPVLIEAVLVFDE